MKLLAIERLRGVAILVVYLIHAKMFGDTFGYFAPLRRIATWAGVDLFFVISGFVVTLSLERLLPERAAPSMRDALAEGDAAALRAFYVRRFFRLAPVGACALLLHLAGAVFGPRLAPATPFLTLREWSFETLAIGCGLYNFVAPFLPRMAMAFFWSLNVEEQFYLLLPTLFVLTGTRRRRTIAAAVILILVAAVIRPAFSPPAFQVAHCSSQFRFDSLLAGVLVGLQRERLAVVARRLPAWVRKAAVFFSLAVLVYVPRHAESFAVHGGLVVLWLASACLVACAYVDGHDVLDMPVVNRVFEYVGSRSYAIYVLHTSFLFLDETIFLGAGGRLRALLDSAVGQSSRFVLVAAAVVVASELAHRYVELPCIAVGKRIAARAVRASAVPEPAL